MGFRKHRRRGGGGGGGGFGGHQQHHGHHGHQSWGGTGEPNGLQPGDDVGNRRSFKQVIQPPDDLGNRKDPDEAEWIPEDNVGNRIDIAPTHEISGVLLDLNGKHRRRRPKGVSAPERVGRYFVGGVNPLIATNVPRAFPGKTLEESMNGTSSAEVSPSDVSDAVTGPEEGFDEERGGRRRRGRGRGRDQVDGVAAQEVSERRAQRFFDFEEDDRFDYTLKTPAEQKRKDAEDAVRNVVVEAGRDATVLARLIDDGNRPKVLVTIEERGPASSLPPERRAENANDPLFVMGNAALMSLNYLINKIVNRYPDDRIRLAILPAADERLYLDALADHQKIRGARPAPAPRHGGRDVDVAPVNGAAPAPVDAAPAAATDRAVADTDSAARAESARVEAARVESARVEAARAESARVEAARIEAARLEAARVESARAEADGDEDEADEDNGDETEAKVDAKAEKPKARPVKKARAVEKDEKPKRPLKRAPKKAPAVEVVRAARPKS